MSAVEFVIRVVDALEWLSVPYMVVGSFSSNAYGLPRSTKDADFVVELGQTPIGRLVAEVGPDFVLDPQMSFETITGAACHTVRQMGTGFVVEVFQLTDEPYNRVRFGRRVRAVIGGRQVFIPTPEDVVVTKLRWSRHGRRHQDVDDARNVLAVQVPGLDLEYVRQWCDQHGTRELLERLLAEATGQ